MQSSIGHIQFNVQPAHLGFYRDLVTFLGWHIIHDASDMIGAMGPHGASLWFAGYVKDVQNDYDGPGMNHMGFGVDRQADVDQAAAYLTRHGVALLFDTPRHRPEFSGSDDTTYYQVMFESPDRILFEVVYIGAKSQVGAGVGFTRGRRARVPPPARSRWGTAHAARATRAGAAAAPPPPRGTQRASATPAVHPGCSCAAGRYPHEHGSPPAEWWAQRRGAYQPARSCSGTSTRAARLFSPGAGA